MIHCNPLTVHIVVVFTLNILVLSYFSIFPYTYVLHVTHYYLLTPICDSCCCNLANVPIVGHKWLFYLISWFWATGVLQGTKGYLLKPHGLNTAKPRESKSNPVNENKRKIWADQSVTQFVKQQKSPSTSSHDSATELQWHLVHL